MYGDFSRASGAISVGRGLGRSAKTMSAWNVRVFVGGAVLFEDLVRGTAAYDFLKLKIWYDIG